MWLKRAALSVACLGGRWNERERGPGEDSGTVDASGLFGVSVDCEEAVHELYHYLDGELTEERRDGDPRPPRLVRALQRRGRLRSRVAQGHRQPVQGPGAREPDPARGRGHRRRKQAAPRRALTSRRRSRRPSPAVRPWWTGPWPSGWRRAPSSSSPRRPPTARADLQGQFDELTARAETLVSEATGLHSAHGTARAKVTDRAGLGRRQRAVGRAPGRTGDAGAAAQARRQARGPVPRRRPRRRRDAARPDARLHGDARARAVRPVDQRRGARGPGPGLLRRPQHRRGRDAVRVRAERVPAVARVARGDPPPAVHGGAVAARPLRRAGQRAARAALGRPGRAGRAGAARHRRAARRAQPHPRRRRGRHAGHARAAARPVEDLGDDEPARGPRRRDHGPGRAPPRSPVPPTSPRSCTSGGPRRGG